MLIEKIVPAAEKLVWVDYEVKNGKGNLGGLLLPPPLGIGMAEKIVEQVGYLSANVESCVVFLKNQVRRHGEETWSSEDVQGYVKKQTDRLLLDPEMVMEHVRESERGEKFLVFGKRLEDPKEDMSEMRVLRNVVYTAQQAYVATDAGLLGLSQFIALKNMLEDMKQEWSTITDEEVQDDTVLLGAMESGFLTKYGVNVRVVENREDDLCICVGKRFNEMISSKKVLAEENKSDQSCSEEDEPSSGEDESSSEEDVEEPEPKRSRKTEPACGGDC